MRASLSLLLVVLLASPAVAITASTPRTSTETQTSDSDASEPEPSCDERLYDAHEEVRAWYHEVEEAWSGFLERQEAEARALEESHASDDEWRAAFERWNAEADALHADAVARFWEQATARLGDCAQRLGEPRAEWEGSWTGESSQSEWSGWEEGEPAEPPEPERHAPPPYAPPPQPEPHPMAGDEAWLALEAEAEAILAACRERVEALHAEAGSEPPDETWWERVHAAERDCAEKVRILYDGYYEERHQEFGDSFGSLRMSWSEDEQRIVVQGRYLELRGDPETATMHDLACRGPRYVDRLAADGFLAEFRPEETDSGTALRVFDDHGGLVFDLHDNGRCTLNLASTASVPWVRLDLADRLACERSDDGGLDCRDGDLRVVVLLHDGEADLGAGNDVTVRGRATFLVSKAAAAADAAEPEAAYEAAYEEAVLQKRVGAEVRIGRSGEGLNVDAAPIGDLQVRVEGGLDGVDVFVESEQGDGKTIWLAVDEALFRNALPGVEAYSVEPDGSERPIPVRQASRLEDVLDPLDDGEAVEYWFGEHEGASVVMVSIPHFSEKRIHLSPDLLGSVGVPAPGIALLAPMLLAAAVVAVRRRA